MTEVRTTSSTGGVKGVKPQRYDLLPKAALDAIAEVLAFGASKYTKRGACTCATAATQSTPEVDAGTATTSCSGQRTLSTQLGSGLTTLDGSSETPNESPSSVRPTGSGSGLERINSTDSRASSTPPTLLNPAASAAPNQSTSTTTMPAARAAQTASVEACATAATSALGISKDGSPSTRPPHLPGCPALTIESSGEHNWRKGYEWSKSYSAAMRHLTAHWDGETLDPESGLPHLAHAGCHITFMLTWLAEQGEGGQFDDRYHPTT